MLDSFRLLCKPQPWFICLLRGLTNKVLTQGAKPLSCKSGALFQKAVCTQGICALRVCGEGPTEGPREEEFIFKLVLLSYRQRCSPPLLTLQPSLRWAPSDSDSEAARE